MNQPHPENAPEGGDSVEIDAMDVITAYQQELANLRHENILLRIQLTQARTKE